jgi:hypothetical protein
MDYETVFSGPNDIADMRDKFRTINPAFSNDA